MKNFIFALMLVLATVFTSCNKTEVTADTQSGNLKLTTIVEEDGDELKSQSINRADVPVYVKGLTIDIDNNNWETVIYVDNGGDDDILLKDVPLTAGLLEATSMPEADPNLPTKFFLMDNKDHVFATADKTTENRNAYLNYMAGLYNVSMLVPYAEYYGQAPINMIAGEANAVEVTLDTENGRDFGTITNESVYTVKIELKAVNQGAGASQSETFMLEPNSTKAVGFYWSNQWATEGTKGIQIKYTWYDAYGNIAKVDNRWRVISRAKESYWSTITVTNSDIKDETLKSTFKFEEIDEIGGDHTV